MPSKTPAQARLMAAAAHTPGGFGGVPQSVGREFNNADKGTHMAFSKGHKPMQASYAAGGPVLGRTVDFMKTPDEFRDPRHANPAADADQKYGKSGPGAGKGEVKAPAAAGKSLKAVKPRK